MLSKAGVISRLTIKRGTRKIDLCGGSVNASGGLLPDCESGDPGNPIGISPAGEALQD
jgi:hypothetical protein